VAICGWAAATRFRIFGSEHPGTKALQLAIGDELVAIAEGAQIGVEDPFAHLVAIEVEERAVIGFVPIELAAVGSGELQRVGSADVVAGEIGLLLAGGLVCCRRAGVPVIAVEPGMVQRVCWS
jgi:hypothetical protein